MRVAVITSGYLPVPPTKGGAVENIVYNLIKKNEKYKKCLYTIYSINDSHDEHFENTNIEYINVSRVSKMMDHIFYFVAKNILKKKHLISYRYYFQRMEFYKKVGKELDINDYDRILMENNVVMFKALCYKNNLKKYKDKIIYHAHNELGKTLGYEKYLNNIKRVIGVSNYITNKYKEYVSNDRVEFSTVYNSIDETLFSKELSDDSKNMLKKILNINNNYPILLFTGRISEEKGILELLRALALLETDKYNLLIVGKTFYASQVKDKFEDSLIIEAQRIKGNVIFTGFVRYDEMYKYYKLADLCILPSVWNEPCALTVIECIVSGTPLITTNTGGTPETITDSTIMLSIDDLENDLSEKIGFLINNKSEFEELKYKSKIEKYKHGTLDDYYMNFVEELN